MKTIYNFLFILITNISLAQTAPEIEWQNTIGGDAGDELTCIRQTADGGYIVGGKSYSGISGDKTEAVIGYPYPYQDYWVLKLDASGNIVWQNDIGGSSTDRLEDIQQTPDGGYILAGYSDSNISGDKTENCYIDMDYWIIKIDSIGNIEWQNTIGAYGNDALLAIDQTTDGGYILGGQSSSDASGDKIEDNIGLAGDPDYWIVKVDSTGEILWQNTIGGDGSDHLRSIQQTSDGGYILGGWSYSDLSNDIPEDEYPPRI
jgi:hypothetical protein